MSSPFAPAVKPTFASVLQKTPYPLMVVTAVIILVAVIVFIIIKVKGNTLKSVNLLTAPIIKANPLSGDYVTTPAGYLPSTTNGNEFTYSIWMFVDNISITNDHKIVLYRGNSQSFANGSFFVYMDAQSNVLYASVRSNAALDDSTSNTEPTLQDIKSNKYFLQSTIEYVPLQRWVNVAYTVKDTVISTFLDGELYSVTSIYELPAKQDGSRALLATQAGDVMTGGKAAQEGFNGYIGNSKYFNFALTVAEAKRVYRQGPYKASWLSYLGLGNVGLRSPVYQITATTATTNTN